MPKSCSLRVQKVDAALRETRGVARREYYAFKEHANFELIENRDEVCLGICATGFAASIFWLGIVAYTRLVEVSMIPSQPFSATQFAHKLRVRNVTLRTVFAPCRENGLVVANLTCFADQMESLNVSDSHARYTFMALDCDRDFKVSLHEMSHALAEEQFSCEAITSIPSTTTTLLAPTLTTASSPNVSTITLTPTSAITSIPSTTAALLAPTLTTAFSPNVSTIKLTTTSSTMIDTSTVEPERCHRHMDSSEQSSNGEVYLVDNTLLHAKWGPGLGYRATMLMNDTCDNESEVWGKDVFGHSHGPDWVEVNGLYLPVRIDGLRVLVEKIGMNLELENVEYSKLMADPVLLQRFREELQKEIASATGEDDAGRVHVTVQNFGVSRRLRGSAPQEPVTLRATLAPPTHLSKEDFLMACSNSDMSCKNLRSRVSSLSIMTEVSSGNVKVSSCSLDDGRPPSKLKSTTARPHTKPMDGKRRQTTTTTSTTIAATTTTTTATTAHIVSLTTTTAALTTSTATVSELVLQPENSAELIMEIGQCLRDKFTTDVEAFADLDTSINGFVEIGEFSQGVERLKLSIKRSISEYFNALDTDDDLQLTYGELQSSMAAAVMQEAEVTTTQERASTEAAAMAAGEHASTSVAKTAAPAAETEKPSGTAAEAAGQSSTSASEAEDLRTSSATDTPVGKPSSTSVAGAAAAEIPTSTAAATTGQSKISASEAGISGTGFTTDTPASTAAATTGQSSTDASEAGDSGTGSTTDTPASTAAATTGQSSTGASEARDSGTDSTTDASARTEGKSDTIAEASTAAPTMQASPTTTVTRTTSTTVTTIPLQNELFQGLQRAFPTIVEAFSALDGDMDGAVGGDELARGIGTYSLPLMRPVDVYIKACDENGDQQLSYAEFDNLQTMS